MRSMKEATELNEARIVTDYMIKNGCEVTKDLGMRIARMDVKDLREFKRLLPNIWELYRLAAEVD